MSKAKTETETKPAVEKGKAREVLFFELEYVAVNGRQIMFDVLKQVMKSKDIDVTPALFARCGLTPRPGKAIQSMIEASGRNLTTGDQLTEQAETIIVKAFADKVVLNKDLAAIIRAAQERNIQVVALSAWPDVAAKELMKKTGLDGMGVDLVAMDSTDPIFPRADHWLRILKQRGQEEIPAIAIVASRAACKGALTAGATCIALPDAYTAFEDFTGAKVVLDTLGDLSAKELFELVSRR
jgi:beta-phosphoglucomutase-like phosphatase (HAD superfamily)